MLGTSETLKTAQDHKHSDDLSIANATVMPNAARTFCTDSADSGVEHRSFGTSNEAQEEATLSCPAFLLLWMA